MLLLPIPPVPVVAMDMRKWDMDLLPKALQESFGPVVDLCLQTKDVNKSANGTLKQAELARDNKSSQIGRGGGTTNVPPGQLLLATLKLGGQNGLCAAMWAVVEPVSHHRSHGAHLKISVVRVVVLEEYRRGPKRLERRNVKLDLFLAMFDAGLRGQSQRVAFTLADAYCISEERGPMWRKIFRSTMDSRSAINLEADGLEEKQIGACRGLVVLPYLWASPTATRVVASPIRQQRHVADEFLDEFLEHRVGGVGARGPAAPLAPGPTPSTSTHLYFNVCLAKTC